MTWLARRRKRAALLREAAALDAEARRQRRSLAEDIRRTFGLHVGVLAMGLATAAEFDPKLRPYGRLLTEPQGSEERAKEYEAQAAAKRAEAAALR